MVQRSPLINQLKLDSSLNLGIEGNLNTNPIIPIIATPQWFDDKAGISFALGPVTACTTSTTTGWCVTYLSNKNATAHASLPIPNSPMCTQRSLGQLS